jgi:serine/threonine-protein kinase
MGKNIMKKINQYKIIEQIWSSSDSTIYEAIHEITQMQIALKIFTNIELISKVKQKIKHGIIPTNYMTLDHKSINRCIDLIIDEDIIALTSEYLIGKNLDELINEKGRLSNVDFTLLMTQIVSAFCHANTKGLIHGNINPADIFIQENGNVKILGFENRILFGNIQTNQTQNQGARIFITPEELMNGNDAIDYKSDIYCVGLILFYALTGLKPKFYCGFQSDNKRSFNPFPEYDFTDSEKKFKSIINKACQLKKTDRFDSFETFKNEILNLSTHNSILPKARRTWWQKLIGYE